MAKQKSPTCKNCHEYINRPCREMPLGEFLSKTDSKKTIKWCNWSSKKIIDFGKDASSCLGYLTQNITHKIKELHTRLRRYERAMELLEGGKKKWVNVKEVGLIIGHPYIIRTVNGVPITKSETIVCNWTQAGWQPVDPNIILSKTCGVKDTVEVLI